MFLFHLSGRIFTSTLVILDENNHALFVLVRIFHRLLWIRQVDGWCWWKTRPLRATRAPNEKMERMRSREDKNILGARAGTVPAIKLVLEEAARQRMTTPSPRERGKVHYCVRGATSKYYVSSCMSRKHVVNRSKSLCVWNCINAVNVTHCRHLSTRILHFWDFWPISNCLIATRNNRWSDKNLFPLMQLMQLISISRSNEYPRI